MFLFYSDNIADDFLELKNEEAGHCARSLRYKEGRQIFVTDGKGNRYHAVLKSVSPKVCTAEIIGREFFEPRAFLTLAVAPAKQPARMEWMVEKAVELGVAAIQLIRTAHTEKGNYKTDRLEKVAISAMKQSLQTRLPEIREIEPFDSWLTQTRQGRGGMIGIAGYPNAVFFGKKYQPGKPNLMLIGPEGDFSEKEIAKALSAGFEPVTLGPNRLRVETACIQACSWAAFCEATSEKGFR